MYLSHLDQLTIFIMQSIIPSIVRHDPSPVPAVLSFHVGLQLQHCSSFKSLRQSITQLVSSDFHLPPCLTYSSFVDIQQRVPSMHHDCLQENYFQQKQKVPPNIYPSSKQACPSITTDEPRQSKPFLT